MVSFSLPARYAPLGPSALPSTFLHRLLLTAPTADARRAVLEAIDWDAPEVRCSSAWDVTEDSARGHLMFSHPLSAVALVGDEALFADALALAHARSTRRIYLDMDRKVEAMVDWVSSGVLGTVVAAGTPRMLRDLTRYLALRARFTRALDHPFSQDDGHDPWRQIALFSPRDRPAAFYQTALDELDRFVRAQQRANVRHSGRKAPPADGTGPLNRWEKQMRAWAYQRTLALAAQYGHAPLAEAILATGCTSVPLYAVAEALRAGGADVALAMLNHPQGWLAWMEHPLDAGHAQGSRHPAVWVGRVSLEELLRTFNALGPFVLEWEGAPAEHRGLADAQLGAADALTLPLLRLLARFSPEQVAAYVQANRDPRQAYDLSDAWPSFLRLDAAGAEEALAILRAQSPDGTVLGALPEVPHWAALRADPDAPWSRLQSARVAALRGPDATAYLARLREEIVRLWRWESQQSKPPPPSGEMHAVAGVWALWAGRPALPAPADWIEALIAEAGLESQQAAACRRRWLDENLRTREGSRPRARM